MKNVFFILTFIYFSLGGAFGQPKESKTFEEKESELIDYSNIKNVLKNDGLSKQKTKRVQYVKEIKKERKKISKGKYFYPAEEDFWAFTSELWLVKNAQLLSWDFPKPEYGIDVAFKNLLEKLGYFNKKFKILIVNSPNIVHFGLPSAKDEYIFLLSLPFIRSLDLTKVDISLVLLEDFFRLEAASFITNLKIKRNLLGTNFYDSKIDQKFMGTVLEAYSKIVLKEGFNFQQQYEVTKKMDKVLKSSPSLWGAYYRVISKIDKFIKSDLLYNNYLKVYPSPELQLQWLAPKKKQI